MGAEQDQLPCGSTGTSSATVKRRKLAWFRHVTSQDSLSKTILQGTLEWSTPWSSEEMLYGQHQRVDIPAHARTAHKGLLMTRLEERIGASFIGMHVAYAKQMRLYHQEGLKCLIQRLQDCV